MRRIYYFKAYNADDTDAIPALRKSDQKPGLYDTVSDQFIIATRIF